MEAIAILEKCIWFGLAALGFSALFNVPQRTMIIIYLMGAAGGITKVLLMYAGINIIIATLLGAIVVGLISIPAAHNKHAPPLVFSIPAVIPMIPGVLAYRMMIGLIKLSSSQVDASYTQTLSETINNGLKVMFILMSLAGGVAVPMLITRKESAKHIRLPRLITDDE